MENVFLLTVFTASIGLSLILMEFIAERIVFYFRRKQRERKELNRRPLYQSISKLNKVERWR